MSNHHFLVVEDSPTMRQLITFSMKRIGKPTIVEASDGVEALKKLAENQFNLVILDINMPMMDGLKLLSIIRKDPKHANIPVIIVTTEGAEADREKGLQLGANAYLSKPVQSGKLIETAKDLLKA